MVWYSHLFQNFPQFIVIHTARWFGIVNKAEADALPSEPPGKFLLDLHTDFSIGMSGIGMWSDIPISFRIFQFVVIHTVKGFGIVNKAKIDVFLELSCFFDDPEDVGNLISGSSPFSNKSLNIWNFMVHVLLKPGLENFEHYFTSV